MWRDGIAEERVRYDRFVVTCLVDCCARSGCLQEALARIGDYERVTRRPYYSMWMALLSGARNARDLAMAERVFAEMRERFEGNDNVMQRAAKLLRIVRNM